MSVSSPREAYVVAVVDELSEAGLPREHLRAVTNAIRSSWQSGFDSAVSGAPDVMRDDVQLHHAVISGVRCYRSHHPDTAVAQGLNGWETSSLAKRIVGNLKSLAKGSGFIPGSRAQEKQERRLRRLSAYINENANINGVGAQAGHPTDPDGR